jgi:hypothetical protein
MGLGEMDAEDAFRGKGVVLDEQREPRCHPARGSFIPTERAALIGNNPIGAVSVGGRHGVKERTGNSPRDTDSLQ